MDAPDRFVRDEMSLDTRRISAWLVQAGLDALPVEQLMAGFCERLNGAGLRIARANVATSTLHPLLRAYGYTWDRRGGNTESLAFAHSDQLNAAWLESPFAFMLANDLTYLRRPLTGPKAKLDFPVLKEFRDDGLTDWYGAAFSFGLDAVVDDKVLVGLICSLSSDRPDGFASSDLVLLEQLLPTLALAVKSIAVHEMSRGLLTTYLGADAAARVLSGTIMRGSTQSVHAVLYYADLRGFTTLADVTPTEELIGMLDDYLECMAKPVEQRGGQVMKFLGDGLLATFGVGAVQPPDVCATALDAAREAMSLVAALNARRRDAGKPVMEIDLALHLGDVLYGNVGSDSRLDFTVIGPAVNEASRIETLCKKLDRNLLISESFAAAATGCAGQLISLGHHPLRGVREPVELFTLAEGGCCA